LKPLPNGTEPRALWGDRYESAANVTRTGNAGNWLKQMPQSFESGASDRV
jgi:hypothetical protein